MNEISRKKKFFIFIFFLILFFLTRLIHLNSDLPQWDVAYYQPIDEAFYGLGGYNMYLFGDYSVFGKYQIQHLEL